ncbi:hypothetical protein MBM_06066 [Drepanopeziza brunnea f. sp. 'multigermtubi' MB_m1]|uniref:Uncharacterized protein n=1 Tax=Marssonina brunnea f. sp. multigermtubi (strain MB_m1) TaxID=1072389 RepID=K1WF18_MARBU|nr:uncharacterized protein MBM_06066 [Drepanopeziza brunnea f. sp. 'multigermtubi' MB_m1]EKD16055.1 hypothetical protein MBM_06066 [Drepanopeziza brunnea f. sp. 'multigermtubi' MB_m1]
MPNILCAYSQLLVAIVRIGSAMVTRLVVMTTLTLVAVNRVGTEARAGPTVRSDTVWWYWGAPMAENDVNDIPSMQEQKGGLSQHQRSFSQRLRQMTQTIPGHQHGWSFAKPGEEPNSLARVCFTHLSHIAASELSHWKEDAADVAASWEIVCDCNPSFYATSFKLALAASTRQVAGSTLRLRLRARVRGQNSTAGS